MRGRVKAAFHISINLIFSTPKNPRGEISSQGPDIDSLVSIREENTYYSRRTVMGRTIGVPPVPRSLWHVSSGPSFL